MKGRRVTLTVEVSLDPVPGWGNTAADFRHAIQRMLDDSMGHYYPLVRVTEEEA